MKGDAGMLKWLGSKRQKENAHASYVALLDAMEDLPPDDRMSFATALVASVASSPKADVVRSRLDRMVCEAVEMINASNCYEQ
ncbi:MAG: hypothetical protein ACR2PG_03475 [Hyphomicrobiaceae bacterium]